MLFASYFSPLCQVSHRIVQNGDTAKDIVQDVFVKLWTNRKQLNIATSLHGYLKQSVINASIDHQRKAYEKKKIRWDDAAGHLDNLVDHAGPIALESQDTTRIVNEALTRLPERCRLVFVLSRHEGLTYRQIADKLEISPKTVENQMSKALKLLRKLLTNVLSIALLTLIILIFYF